MVKVGRKISACVKNCFNFGIIMCGKECFSGANMNRQARSHYKFVPEAACGASARKHDALTAMLTEKGCREVRHRRQLDEDRPRRTNQWVGVRKALGAEGEGNAGAVARGIALDAVASIQHGKDALCRCEGEAGALGDLIQAERSIGVIKHFEHVNCSFE